MKITYDDLDAVERKLVFLAQLEYEADGVFHVDTELKLLDLGLDPISLEIQFHLNNLIHHRKNQNG